MFKNRKQIFAVALFAVLVGTSGCNNGMTLSSNRPNSSSNSARVVVGASSNNNNSGYSAAVTLGFFAGSAASEGLRNTSVQKSSTDGRQLRVTTPNLGLNQSICVITGVQYDQDRCGLGSYFTDIGEQVCLISTASGGSLNFNLARSDYNIVTVVLQSDLQQFTDWVNGNVATSAYPGMAQGQISAVIPHPACPF